MPSVPSSVKPNEKKSATIASFSIDAGVSNTNKRPIRSSSSIPNKFVFVFMLSNNDSDCASVLLTKLSAVTPGARSSATIIGAPVFLSKYTVTSSLVIDLISKLSRLNPLKSPAGSFMESKRSSAVASRSIIVALYRVVVSLALKVALLLNFSTANKASASKPAIVGTALNPSA